MKRGLTRAAKGRVLGLTALCVLGVLTPASADGMKDRALALMMEKTELAYTQNETGDYLVTFEAEGVEELEEWTVTIRFTPSQNWVMVYVTMIDGPRGTRFPPRLVERALSYNSDTVGGKLALDLTFGDIDVQYEIPSDHLTAEFLAFVIRDVASTCSIAYREFKEMME